MEGGGGDGTRRNPGSLRLRGRRLADSVTRAAGADHLSPQTIMTERVESKKRFLKSSVVILRSGRALHHAVRSAAFFCDDDFPSDFCLQIAVGSLEAYLKQAAARLAWPALGPSGCTHSQECGIPSADTTQPDCRPLPRCWPCNTLLPVLLFAVLACPVAVFSLSSGFL